MYTVGVTYQSSALQVHASSFDISCFYLCLLLFYGRKKNLIILGYFLCEVFFFPLDYLTRVFCHLSHSGYSNFVSVCFLCHFKDN